MINEKFLNMFDGKTVRVTEPLKLPNGETIGTQTNLVVVDHYQGDLLLAPASTVTNNRLDGILGERNGDGKHNIQVQPFDEKSEFYHPIEIVTE